MRTPIDPHDERRTSADAPRVFVAAGWLARACAWLWIAAAPTCVALVLAFVASKVLPDPWSWIAPPPIALPGILLGILWAERWRRRGRLIWFMSRRNATPELDRAPNPSAGRDRTTASKSPRR